MEFRLSLQVFSLALLALLVSGDPGVPRPRRCSLRHYHSLDPKALAAVKTFRDFSEQEMMSWGRRNCSFSRQKELRKVLSKYTPGYDHSGPRPGRPRELARLAEPRRLEDIATTQLWTRDRDPERKSPGQGKWAQPPDSDSQVSPSHGRLEGMDRSSKNWRKYIQERRLHKTKILESPRCREAETILSLLKLLTFDLKLAVLAGSCA